MRVREAVDDVVGIMIAAAAVPVVDAGVGRKLHHSERQRRSRKRVPVPAGAYERVDPSAEIAGLSNKQ